MQAPPVIALRQPAPPTQPVGGPGVLRRSFPLVAWVAALAAVLAGAIALGSTPALAAPPLTRPGELGDWAAARQPVEAAFAVLRVVVVALACYLLFVTVLAVVLRLGRAGRLVTAFDVLTLPWVRRIVQGALGVGLIGATLAAVGSAAVDPSANPSRTFTAADVRLAASAPEHPRAGDDLLVRLPDVEPGPPTLQRVDEAAPAAPSAPAGEVTLEAGDHLWSVAERALTDAWGRAPSDAELAPFWEQVVEANRDRLPDPANPDLVFPGEVVTVPPPPAP